MNLAELNKLDWNNIGSWPAAAKAMVIGFVCVLLIVAGYFYDLQDQQTLLEQAEQKEQTLKQDLEAKQAKVVNIEALKQQLADIKQSFGDMLKRLPNKTEVASLLVDISQQGLGAGLEFELFKPGNETPADFYVELPIEVRVTGGYHQLGQFVSGVADLPRIVTQHDIKIKPLDAAKAKDKPGGLVMESIAKTYHYQGEEEAMQPAAAPGAQSGAAQPSPVPAGTATPK